MGETGVTSTSGVGQPGWQQRLKDESLNPSGTLWALLAEAGTACCRCESPAGQTLCLPAELRGACELCVPVNG